MKKNTVIVDETAANDLVRASELYRKGDFDLALMLIDKSAMRALTVLLKQHGITPNKEKYFNAFQLMRLVSDKKLITNEELLFNSVRSLHDMKNYLMHGHEMKIDANLVRHFLDVGYELLGIIPYDKEKSIKFKKFANKKSLNAVLSFEDTARNFLIKKFAKTKSIHFQKLLGIPGTTYRPDAYFEDKKGNITLVEFKYKITNKNALIHNLTTVINSMSAINPKIKKLLLILPKSIDNKVTQQTVTTLEGNSVDVYFI